MGNYRNYIIRYSNRIATTGDTGEQMKMKDEQLTVSTTNTLQNQRTETVTENSASMFMRIQV